MRRPSITLVQCAALCAAVVALGCGGSSDSGTQPPPHATNKTVDVFTIGVVFSPTTANIAVGDTVRWNFQTASDGHGHNVVFSPRVTGAPSDISAELKSGTASRVFTSAGTYQYVCTLHGSMAGTVIVQ